MDVPSLAGRAAAVRRFNRFYTQKIGVLEEGLLQSRFSLTEVRVLYELAHRDRPTASALARELGLDQGYLSRILSRFERCGLVSRAASDTDGRQTHLSLTASGLATFAPLERATDESVATMLSGLSEPDQVHLLAAMARIEALLGAPAEPAAPFLLRSPRPGDYGWVVHRQGALYASEYGWDETFEALVAEIVAKFVRNFDPHGEGCWLAERSGRVVGSVFLVRDSKTVGKLRLLYVEPEARGLGIGQRLVAECIAGARRAGYARLTLWTNDVLVSARRIYEAAGFRLVREEKHHSFGKDLIGQFWELPL
ncbi:MAG: helix-turn-helix domain-containing GNAT family N-acetyltransferase [Rhodospirillales bacterium]|nr:helix-turn-helix domain-containing GNAT family N-acetyltransferase [Rhodospirillales bacterium]